MEKLKDIASWNLAVKAAKAIQKKCMKRKLSIAQTVTRYRAIAGQEVAAIKT
ncbi:hypothetical protein [Paenibacillus ehimensis]|uniref:hypothetical protein n=1 Tax=Paenibacillus ehimensis TaxID=79264 RepID=UPI001377CDAA|nr:hypothetical protein [Paenibacillus ehimensis]